MRELYELKEMLCKELKEYGAKGELTGGALEIVDKLAHAVKNIDKIIEVYEMQEEGSYAGGQGGSYRGYSREGYSREGGRGGSNYSREGSYRGGSYARGRGQNARRDSMGRYSNRGYSRTGDTEEYVEQLQEMMQELPPEAQQHVQKAIEKMEQM